MSAISQKGLCCSSLSVWKNCCYNIKQKQTKESLTIDKDRKAVTTREPLLSSTIISYYPTIRVMWKPMGPNRCSCSMVYHMEIKFYHSVFDFIWFLITEEENILSLPKSTQSIFTLPPPPPVPLHQSLTLSYQTLWLPSWALITQFVV